MAVLPAGVEAYNLPMVYIPPDAVESVGVKINSRLKQRLEDSARMHHRARTGYGTQRAIIEAAVSQWLDRYERPELKAG